MRQTCLVFFALCLFTPSAWAQSATPLKPPVLATVEAVPVKGARPGSTVKLVINVAPRQGIHIYAPPEKQYRPISATVTPAGGVRVGKPELPPSVKRTFEGESVHVYDKPFAITIPAVLPRSGPDAVKLSGTVFYQACDDLVCYRPVTVPVSWEIRLQ